MMTKPAPRFRLWALALYGIGGAILNSCIVAFSRIPPSREYLGDEGYYRVWRVIIVAGAAMGCMVYCITWFAARVSQWRAGVPPSRQFSLRQLLVTITLVAVVLGIVVWLNS